MGMRVLGVLGVCGGLTRFGIGLGGTGSSTVADLQDDDELGCIVDEIDDAIEVRFVAVDELAVGGIFGGGGAHAWGRRHREDELFEAMKPAFGGG